MKHNSVFKINVNQIKENFQHILSNLGRETNVILVLKSNAYGHGLLKIAELFEKEKRVTHLGIAQPLEAIELRQHGINKDIMLLCGIDPSQLELMVENNIQLLIHSDESLRMITQYLKEKDIKDYPVNLKINTGLNRLGFTINELKETIHLLSNNPHIKIQSTYTHFKDGAAQYSEVTYHQKELYDEAILLLEKHKVDYGFKHLCDSGASEWFKEAHYDAVRVGRALYMDNPLKPEKERYHDVGTWMAKLISIREIKKGDSYGYGHAKIADKNMTIGIINIGYGDGLLILEDQIEIYVLVNNKKAKILSVAMDQTYLDLTGISARPYDEVTIFGTSSTGSYMSSNEISKQFGDEGCTLTTYISKRVKREYIL